MHGKRHADATPETPFATLAALLRPVQLLFDNLQALGQTTALDDLRIAFFAFSQRFRQWVLIALFEPVLAAQCQRVHAQLFRYLVNMALQSEKALRYAIATKRSGRRQVGVNDLCDKTDIWTGIKRQGFGASVTLHGH